MRANSSAGTHPHRRFRQSVHYSSLEKGGGEWKEKFLATFDKAACQLVALIAPAVALTANFLESEEGGEKGRKKSPPIWKKSCHPRWKGTNGEPA